MFLRCTQRKKDGKEHRYWSIVENRRCSGGKIVQRPVLYLGEVNDSQREVQWQRDGEARVAVVAAMTGTDAATYSRERVGMSAFAIEDGIAYHTYSTHMRGLDGLWGMYQWLDRAPRGRNETGIWWRRHDEYELS
jgi:predicted dithiol-disulfide oxidoreductase (DUF899 family)